MCVTHPHLRPGVTPPDSLTPVVPRVLDLGCLAAQIAHFFAGLRVLRLHWNEKIAVFAHPQRNSSLKRKDIVRLHELKVPHLPCIVEIIGLLDDDSIHLENIAWSSRRFLGRFDHLQYGEQRDSGLVGHIVRAFVEMTARLEGGRYGTLRIRIVLGIAADRSAGKLVPAGNDAGNPELGEELHTFLFGDQERLLGYWG